jgi:hypothetical protein
MLQSAQDYRYSVMPSEQDSRYFVTHQRGLQAQCYSSEQDSRHSVTHQSRISGTVLPIRAGLQILIQCYHQSRTWVVSPSLQYLVPILGSVYRKRSTPVKGTVSIIGRLLIKCTL